MSLKVDACTSKLYNHEKNSLTKAGRITTVSLVALGVLAAAIAALALVLTCQNVPQLTLFSGLGTIGYPGGIIMGIASLSILALGVSLPLILGKCKKEKTLLPSDTTVNTSDSSTKSPKKSTSSRKSKTLSLHSGSASAKRQSQKIKSSDDNNQTIETYLNFFKESLANDEYTIYETENGVEYYLSASKGPIQKDENFEIEPNKKLIDFRQLEKEIYEPIEQFLELREKLKDYECVQFPSESKPFDLLVGNQLLVEEEFVQCISPDVKDDDGRLSFPTKQARTAFLDTVKSKLVHQSEEISAAAKSKPLPKFEEIAYEVLLKRPNKNHKLVEQCRDVATFYERVWCSLEEKEVFIFQPQNSTKCVLLFAETKKEVNQSSLEQEIIKLEQSGHNIVLYSALNARQKQKVINCDYYLANEALQSGEYGYIESMRLLLWKDKDGVPDSFPILPSNIQKFAEDNGFTYLTETELDKRVTNSTSEAEED